MKADLEAARALLRQCALFHNLSAEVRDKIVARARMRRFANRETIFSAGDPRESLMAIMTGTVQISGFAPDGRQIVLAILHAGEVFGEIALLDGKARSADARAMADCTVAVIDRSDVVDLLDRHPEAWRSFVEVLCARLRSTDEHLVEIALLDLPSRLAHALLRFAEPGKQGPRAVRLSQRDLGNIVSASRERVNHWLQEWQRAGVVKVAKGAILLLDEKRLQDLPKPARRLGTRVARVQSL